MLPLHTPIAAGVVQVPPTRSFSQHVEVHNLTFRVEDGYSHVRISAPDFSALNFLPYPPRPMLS